MLTIKDETIYLEILVLCELAGEDSGLLAAHSQQAVVGRQHDSIKIDNFGIFVIGQDVVVRDVLGHVRVSKDQPDVFRTILTQRVPEVEESLLVVVNRNGRFRQFWMKELPEVDEVRFKHSLLGLGQQKVGHGLEVGDELGRTVLLQVGVLACVRQQAEQKFQDLKNKRVKFTI